MQPRTDLAMEAKALYERSAQEQTKLSGVIAREQERHGVRMTVVKITSAEGEQALGKPRGTRGAHAPGTGQLFQCRADSRASAA